MHIAFISTQFVSLSLTGGLGNHLQRVGLSLVAMGHKPTILMISDKDDDEEYQGIRLIRIGAKPASVLRRIGAGTLHANAYQSKRFRRALLKLHKRDPIDICQYTNYRATAIYREPSIPAVMRISSYRPLWDPLHPKAAKSLRRRYAAYLERRSFEKVDAIYAPSRVLAQTITKDTGFPVKVIEPPFVMDVLDRDESLLKDVVGVSPFFLFAGSLTRRKGAEAITKAIPHLLSKYPDHLFVFVGKTEETVSSDTIEEARRAAGNASQRIVHHGPVPHHKLYPFYERADLVLLPSIIDNIANTALEAMALGASVVGTDGGSFEQLIEDGTNGFLCEPGNAQSLLKAVDRGMEMSSSERIALGQRAKKRIEELAPEKTIPQLLDYYRSVVAGYTQ